MGHVPEKLSDLSNRALELRVHTRSQAQSSTAGISTYWPCWDLQSPHSWRGGFPLNSTFSYGASHCYLRRILIFSKLHWAERSSLKNILVSIPRQIMKHRSFHTRGRGTMGTSLLEDSCISLCQQIRTAPKAICFMSIFRIDGLPSPFLMFHFSQHEGIQTTLIPIISLAGLWDVSMLRC